MMDFPSSLRDWYPNIISDANLDFSDIGKLGPSILSSVHDHSILILDSSITSNKSLFIPQLLFQSGLTEGGWKIAVVYPNKKTAFLKTNLLYKLIGKTIVGLNLDVYDSNQSQTYIQVFTPEALLNEIRKNPNLDNKSNPFSAVYFDSFPDSGSKGELCLSLLNTICLSRPQFRLIIGTIANDLVGELIGYFNATGTEGRVAHYTLDSIRSPSIKIKHLTGVPKDTENFVIRTIIDINKTSPSGNVLVFLPTAQHCQNLIDMLKQLKDTNLTAVGREGKIVASYSNSRYIYFATSAYQIDRGYLNIKYIIDSGQMFYPEWSKGILYSDPIRVTEREANLRSTFPSQVTVYRLYPPNSFSHESNKPDYEFLVMMLSTLRINTFKEFPFFRKIDLGEIGRNLYILQKMGTLTSLGELTPSIGDRMISFGGISPGFAKMIVSSYEFGCTEEIITIISMLNANTKFSFGQSRSKEGDLISMANYYRTLQSSNDPSLRHVKEQVKEERKRLRERAEKVGKLSSCRNAEVIIKTICSGFFMNAAVFNIHMQCFIHCGTGERLYIHPSSVLRELDMRLHVYYVVFTHLECSGGKMLMRNITVIDDPSVIVQSSNGYWDDIPGKTKKAPTRTKRMLLDESMVPKNLLGLYHDYARRI